MRRSMLAAAVVSGAVTLSLFGQQPGEAPAAAQVPGQPAAPAEQAPPGAPAAPVNPTIPVPAPPAYKVRVGAAPAGAPAPGGGGLVFPPDAAAPAPVKMQKLTFLGINTSPAPAHLREELKL